MQPLTNDTPSSLHPFPVGRPRPPFWTHLLGTCLCQAGPGEVRSWLCGFWSLRVSVLAGGLRWPDST